MPCGGMPCGGMPHGTEGMFEACARARKATGRRQILEACCRARKATGRRQKSVCGSLQHITDPSPTRCPTRLREGDT